MTPKLHSFLQKNPNHQTIQTLCSCLPDEAVDALALLTSCPRFFLGSTDVGGRGQVPSEAPAVHLPVPLPVLQSCTHPTSLVPLACLHHTAGLVSSPPPWVGTPQPLCCHFRVSAITVGCRAFCAPRLCRV